MTFTGIPQCLGVSDRCRSRAPAPVLPSVPLAFRRALATWRSPIPDNSAQDLTVVPPSTGNTH